MACIIRMTHNVCALHLGCKRGGGLSVSCLHEAPCYNFHRTIHTRIHASQACHCRRYHHRHHLTQNAALSLYMWVCFKVNGEGSHPTYLSPPNTIPFHGHYSCQLLLHLLAEEVGNKPTNFFLLYNN